MKYQYFLQSFAETKLSFRSKRTERPAACLGMLAAGRVIWAAGTVLTHSDRLSVCPKGLTLSAPGFSVGWAVYEDGDFFDFF